MAIFLTPSTLYRGPISGVFIGTDAEGAPWTFPSAPGGWERRKPYQGSPRGLTLVGARHGATAGFPWARPVRDENLNIRLPACKLAAYRSAAKSARRKFTAWVEESLDAAAARPAPPTSSPPPSSTRRSTTP